jgi:hypothetical protein
MGWKKMLMEFVGHGKHFYLFFPLHFGLLYKNENNQGIKHGLILVFYCPTLVVVNAWPKP